jgi:hypothetical protein
MRYWRAFHRHMRGILADIKRHGQPAGGWVGGPGGSRSTGCSRGNMDAHWSVPLIIPQPFSIIPQCRIIPLLRCLLIAIFCHGGVMIAPLLRCTPADCDESISAHLLRLKDPHTGQPLSGMPCPALGLAQICSCSGLLLSCLPSRPHRCCSPLLHALKRPLCPLCCRRPLGA